MIMPVSSLSYIGGVFDGPATHAMAAGARHGSTTRLGMSGGHDHRPVRQAACPDAPGGPDCCARW